MTTFTRWRVELRAAAGACALVLLSLTACQSKRASPTEKARAESRALSGASAPEPPVTFEPGSADEGKKLVAAFECNRCHEGTGLAAPKLDQDCVGCHEQIATDKFQASASKLAKWKPHIAPYRDVPSLTSLGGRVRPAWVMQYLLSPHDLRPQLAQTMPRLAMSREQARDIATYLTMSSGAQPLPVVERQPSAIAHGRELMTTRGCVTCHEMSGAGLPSPPVSAPIARTLGLAPDLRFARERSEPAMLARWLVAPSRVKHDAVMPSLALSPEDARDLAAFLSFADLAPAPVRSLPARLPLLERRVGFDELNEKVFAVTCRHCHTSPESAGGDGGPGNTGGFGFKPRKIDFSSYQGIQAGGLDENGERVSLFRPMSDGTPWLVAALVARQREVSGQPPDSARGMPLGLPPLSPEQLQLVESWVAQGRPL